MLPQFQQQVLRVDVHRLRGRPLTTRFGSWPLIAWVVLALGFCPTGNVAAAEA